MSFSGLCVQAVESRNTQAVVAVRANFIDIGAYLDCRRCMRHSKSRCSQVPRMEWLSRCQFSAIQATLALIISEQDAKTRFFRPRPSEPHHFRPYSDSSANSRTSCAENKGSRTAPGATALRAWVIRRYIHFD